MDCAAHVEYDGEGFDDLGGDGGDADGHDPGEGRQHYHIPLVADDGSVVRTLTDPEKAAELEDFRFDFEALVFDDHIHIEIPHAPHCEWFESLIGNVCAHLDEEFGVVAGDDTGEITYHYDYAIGCPHPLIGMRGVLDLFEEAVDVSLTREEAENFGLDVDGTVEATRLDIEEDAIYYLPEENFVKPIAGDVDDLLYELNRRAIGRLMDIVPFEEIDNPYAESGLVPDDAIAGWVVVNGDDAVGLWNAVAPHLFAADYHDEVLAGKVNDDLGIPRLHALRLFAELVATLQYEVPAHPAVNLDDHHETVAEIDGVATPTEEHHHGWVGGQEFLDGIMRETAGLPNDAYDYDRDALEADMLVDIHAPDDPVLITFRITDYEPVTEDEAADDSFLTPMGWLAEPVAARPCGHGDDASDEEIKALLADTGATYIVSNMLEVAEEAPEDVLDRAITLDE